MAEEQGDSPPDVGLAELGEDARESPVRRLEALSTAESIRRLGSVQLGRVVFTENALPAIRPVNHLVDRGAVIIRTHLGAAVLGRVGAVVAYEVDSIDPVTHLGWSVVVTGIAQLVTREDELLRYQRMLRPWVSQSMDHVIRIELHIVKGFAIVGPE